MNIKKELIAQRDPKSPVSEVFRTLRTNIQFMNTNKKLKSLLITSTFPNEGKSWIASNLAVTFAQAGKRVILIDADMRKGRQYTIFGVLPRPGLSNYLSGVDIENPDNTDLSQYIQRTEIDNLLVMPAGNVPPNPSELLVSTQMIRLIEDLKEVCDLVIIDGTPCELVADSIILSRIVDSTVLITAHKETKRENLKRVIKNIQNVGGQLAGVVVNKMPTSSRKYNDKYYYYGYYGQSSSRNSVKESFRKVERKSTNSRKMSKNDYADELEVPEFLKNNINMEATVDKSQEILEQINDYLNKGEQR